MVHYPARFDVVCRGVVPALIGIEQQDVSPDYLNQLKQEGLATTFRLQLLDAGRLHGNTGETVSANLSVSDLWEVQQTNSTVLLMGGIVGSFHWSCSGEHAIVKGSITAWLVPPELAPHNVTTFRAHLQLVRVSTGPVLNLNATTGGLYTSKRSNNAEEASNVATLGIQQRDGRQGTIAGPITTAIITPTGMLLARATVSNGSHSSVELSNLAANPIVSRLALNFTLPELNVSIKLQAGPGGYDLVDDLIHHVYPAGDDEEAILLQPSKSFCRTGVAGHAMFVNDLLSVGLEGVLCVVIHPPVPSDSQQVPTNRIDVLTFVSITHRVLEEGSAGYDNCRAPAAAEGTAQFQGSLGGQSFIGTFKSTSTEFIRADIAREQARLGQVASSGPCYDSQRYSPARWTYFHTATFTGHVPAIVGNSTGDPAQFAVAVDVPGYGKLVHSFHLLHSTANGTLAAHLEYGNGALRLQGELEASTASPCAGGFAFDNGTGSYMLDIVPNNTSMGTDVIGWLQWTGFHTASWLHKQESESCPGCVVLPEATLPDVVAFNSASNQNRTLNATGYVELSLSVPVCNGTITWEGLALTAPIHANIEHLTIIKHTGLVSMAIFVPENQTAFATAAFTNGGSSGDDLNNCSAEAVAQMAGPSTLALWQAVRAQTLPAKEVLQLLVNSYLYYGRMKLSFTLPANNLEMTVQVGWTDLLLKD
jgi:hypothetical protein